jgi:hypothetical protein
MGKERPVISRGSVLIVVLGLLAILAVVGITFVTMSSIDSNTASNFSLQAGFELAADGMIDRVAHDAVAELWEVNISRSGYTGALMTKDAAGAAPGCRPYTSPGETAWLTSPIDTTASATQPVFWSYKGVSTKTFYGLNLSTSALPTGTDAADNLGLNFGSTIGTGVWNPDFYMPYEAGLIRGSVNVIDHSGLIQLNAHGNKNASKWPLGDSIGFGYFISDVDPSATGLVDDKVYNGNGTVPGSWGIGPNDPCPGGACGETLIDNPALPWDMAKSVGGPDCPFTLDDEYNLRRLTAANNTYPTRLKALAPNIFATPKNQFLFTTYNFTSEASGDWYWDTATSGTHLTVATHVSSQTWSEPKADLNDMHLTDDQATGIIGNALRHASAVPQLIQGTTNTWTAQFIANILAFRDGKNSGCGIKQYSINPSSGGGQVNAVGAARQPILSKFALASGPTAVVSGGSTTYTYTIDVQVMSPWLNDNALQAADAGLTTGAMQIQADLSSGTCAGVDIATSLKNRAADKKTITIKGATSNDITQVLKTIKLVYTTVGKTLDLFDIQDFPSANLTTGFWRPIYWEDEKRSPSDPSPVLVVYVGQWLVGLNGSIDTYAIANKTQTSGIPIRFPRSCNAYNGNYSNLPPRALAAQQPFKAFARLGDLNQVLCFTGSSPTDENPDKFWPWLPRISNPDPKGTEVPIGDPQRTQKLEAHRKFDWLHSDSSGGLPLPNGTVYCAYAACVLTVGGPWYDGIDNDGDGYGDDLDVGKINGNVDKGRFGGPEMRVAGKINLNSATPSTLTALATGVGVDPTSLREAVKQAKGGTNGINAIKTPAAILNIADTSDPTKPMLKATAGITTAKGPLETRDEGYVRISNIASVRGDTFSIYGTVQYGTVNRVSATTATYSVLRSRRFWALMDRSPSLAYYPAGGVGSDPSSFIHPRILNFQWLN